jgi:DAK2 domain fusion protein YloV
VAHSGTMGTGLDGTTLRDAMSRYLDALRAHREEIDSLNVFPVPDGDTGTNLLLTQEAVVEALRDPDHATLGEVGEAVSRAALMGARGNSGVILSQVLRGLCGRLGTTEEAGGRELADALAAASDDARAAVVRPVEGTMLSVIRDAAEAASRVDGADPGPVARRALEAALDSLEGTRSQLPELERAGVVDAGAKGLVLLLDALHAAITGKERVVSVGPLGPVGERSPGGGPAPTEYGYEVMYLLECDDDRVPPLRERLGDLGGSLVVVGGGGLYNVHVHTENPGAAVEEGVDAGRPHRIRITSLDAQVVEACLAGEARGVRAAEAPVATALVAVAPGEGAAELFRSLGARVVPGGPGRTPSVAELLQAVNEAPAGAVLLLPNHLNVIPAAERAADAAADDVRVVATTSVPEGLAAATAFAPDREVEANQDEAGKASAAVTAAEVAEAAGDARTPAGSVRAGDLVGVVDGEVRAIGTDPAAVAIALLRPLVAPEHEVLTVLLGREVDGAAGDRIGAAVAEAFPGLEVEVHRGDQPHSPLLLGVE